MVSPVFSLGLGITPGFPGSEALRLGMDHRAAHKGLYLAEAYHHTDEPPKSCEPILPINPLPLLLIHLSEEPRLSDLGLWLLRFPMEDEALALHSALFVWISVQ